MADAIAVVPKAKSARQSASAFNLLNLKVFQPASPAKSP
jgi:hypothetical protein